MCVVVMKDREILCQVEMFNLFFPCSPHYRGPNKLSPQTLAIKRAKMERSRQGILPNVADIHSPIVTPVSWDLGNETFEILSHTPSNDPP